MVSGGACDLARQQDTWAGLFTLVSSQVYKTPGRVDLAPTHQNLTA